MAIYAFRDEERQNILYASNAIIEDRDVSFYCPNPFCNAKLFICAMEGSNKAYFRATKPQLGHLKNCPHGSCNVEFIEDQFDEYGFDFNNAIENILVSTARQKSNKTSGVHKDGEIGKHPLRTIRQIYLMCKSRPVTDSYNGKKIGEMILDDRDLSWYPRGCFGKRIIESYAKNLLYDNNNKEIYLAAPLQSKKYTFVLNFTDYETYRTIRDEIYNNNDRIIVVAGNWKSSGRYNFFISEMSGRKQVAVI